ncbi:hypothetical protein [Pseudomonas sp. LF245]
MLSKFAPQEIAKICEYFVCAMDQCPDGFLAGMAQGWIEDFSQQATADGLLSSEHDLGAVLHCFLSIFYLNLKVLRQASIVINLDSTDENISKAQRKILYLIEQTAIHRVDDPNLTALEWLLY